MAISFIFAFDDTGAPLTGLTPTFSALYRADTLQPITTLPTISEVGGGVYKYTSPVDAATGMISMGATASPEYQFLPSNTETTFAAFSASTGAPLTGLTPTFTSYRNGTTGAVISPSPDITEIGNGIYVVESMADGAVGQVDLGATATPRYVGITGLLEADPNADLVNLPWMSLGAIRLAAQQRADMEGSEFISEEEWNSYINLSYYELYDLLVRTSEDYYITEYEFTSNGAEAYDLPSDFYKLKGLDVANTSGSTPWLTARPFMFNERNQLSNNGYNNVLTPYYRIRADKIWIKPVQSGRAMRLWYIPRLEPLVNDEDEADGVSGWLEYVIVDAAIKAMQKEESDVSVLMAQKQALIKRIEVTAPNRDTGFPARVIDTASGGNRREGSFFANDDAWGW